MSDLLNAGADIVTVSKMGDMPACRPRPGMIATTIRAGIGGSGVFKGYLESSKASMQASRAELYRAAAWDAMRGVDVQERLEDLQQSDEEIKRRWEPW